MTRALARLLTLVALVASALVLPGAVTSPTPAAAADLSWFKPGNIISDAVFFDSLSTDPGTVQSFLQTKGAKCVAGEMPCLKDYTQTTADQAGDGYCQTYRGAANENAATILVKIGQACGINPRVLLVLLQKEQGLVTGTRPSARAYTKATGFGCPDTAACNPAFSGFVSQVYFAARQFQRYAAGVAGSYRAGRDNTVLYHPNSACGSSKVYIENKATAGLYSYTPYQPNAAALAAGYGSGDGCSSYGNRNFWNYFTDWFGSTQSTGGGAILEKYQQTGGASGSLGGATGGFVCGLVDGGCYQSFQGGTIYWAPGTGAHTLVGDQLAAFRGSGSEGGWLGYPASDLICGLTQSGCYQVFGRGAVYSTPTTGTRIIRGAVLTVFQAQGSEWGALGYPMGNEVYGLAGGGSYQQFQGGRVYWSPAVGTYPVLREQLDRWATLGGESGTYGYPRSGLLCGLVRSGCYQLFTGGVLYTTPTTGTHALQGGALEAFKAQRSEWGPLGYPTSELSYGLPSGGSYQEFEGGTLYWSPNTGVHSVVGDQRNRYVALGGVKGPFGFPRTEPICGLIQAGCYQVFTGGTLFSTPATGIHGLRGGALTTWQAQGSEYGPLGYPTGDETYGLAGGGSYQEFQGGRIYWSPPTGVQVVRGPVLAYWLDLGGESSEAGYPTAAATVSGTVTTQKFAGGRLSWDSATSKGTFTRS